MIDTDYPIHWYYIGKSYYLSYHEDGEEKSILLGGEGTKRWKLEERALRLEAALLLKRAAQLQVKAAENEIKEKKDD